MSSFLSKLLAQVHASHAKIDLPFHFTFKTASAPFVMKVNENNFAKQNHVNLLLTDFFLPFVQVHGAARLTSNSLLLTKHGSIMLELRLLY